VLALRNHLATEASQTPAWPIRDACRADVPQLAAVRNASWRAAYRGIVPDAELDRMSLSRSSALLQKAISDRRRGKILLLAESKPGHPCGYVYAGPQPDHKLRHAGEIYELYLVPQEQRHGIGTRLLAAALWRLSALGSSPVMLWVLAANRAQRFYASCGGRPILRASIEVGGRRLERIAYSWRDFLPLPLQ
jgi:GNAT superfamily N-acetyltransferase